MEIRINGKKIKAQILPVDKPTLDETLESFSFALVSNDNPMPFAPCQSVQVITDSNEKINLFLVTDSVEVYSVTPTRWKHNITCVQNTRKLSKHLVRNSSFTTPSYLEKKSFNAWSMSLHRKNNNNMDMDYVTMTSNVNYEPIELRTINNYAREKIKNAYLEIRCNGILCDITTSNPPNLKYGNGRWVNNIKNVADIKNADTSAVFTFSNLTLGYSDSNGNDVTEEITSNDVEFDGDWYPLNRKVRFDRIKELADQGCNNFHIITRPIPVGGDVTIDNSDFWMIFTFQVMINIETYYYNCYQILDLLRIRQQKHRHENGNWVFDSFLFNLDPNRDLEKMLIATPAPNFTFTQMTMYECVAEVFRLFDAIFTMDENGYLGIEYFNERNGRNITDSLKKVGQNSTSSEDKYTNGLVAYYQNAKPVEEFPSRNDVYASVRTKNLGVPSSNNDFVFEVPHKIDEVLDCKFYYKEDNAIVIKTRLRTPPYAGHTEGDQVTIGDGGDWNISGFPILDITHFIVKEDLWTLLSKQESMYDEYGILSNPANLMQINTVFVSNNSNYIDISYTYERYFWQTTDFALNNLINCALWRSFGATQIDDSDDSDDRKIYLKGSIGGNWNKIAMKLKYVTTVDGRVKIESFQRKYDGETLIDQYNGAVDLNKMGLIILGLSLKLGNPTLTVTQKITSWNNRIKQGDIYNYEGKTWIANVVAYTFLGDGKIQATIQFVQNFNNLAMRTQLLREKRMSNISGELTVKSEENLVDYVYFSTEYANIQANAIGYKDYMIRTNLYASLGGGASALVPAEMAVIETNSTAYKVYIPMIKYGSGNMICHEISFNDPISAGKQTTYHDDSWFNTYYFTNILKYTNDYGEFELVNIHILPSSEVGMVPELYPYVDAITAYQNVEILNLAYHKQPNEIFALNYQLCFLPWDANKDFIGSRFINYNAFVNDTTRKPSDLVLYYRNDDFQYSVLDIKGDGSTVDITSVSPGTPEDHVYLYGFRLSQRITATSWAICERDGTILFASNRKITNANSVELCFATNSHRVDKKILDEF